MLRHIFWKERYNIGTLSNIPQGIRIDARHLFDRFQHWHWNYQHPRVRFIPNVPVFSVSGQRMPFWFLVQETYCQFQDSLAEEIVRLVPSVVPDRNLQCSLPQLRTSDSIINESLIPSGIVRVCHSLRTSFRFFATVTFKKRTYKTFGSLSGN